MAAPTVTDTTAAIYGELPEHHRTADETIGWPLLRYLAVIGDQAQALVDVRDQLEAGLLARPADVPAGWLDWLAQFVALDTDGLTVPEKRLGISTAAALQAGSMRSLEETVANLLGGQKRYIVDLHSGGDPWAIRVYANADDAGGTTWDLLALKYPSWNAWEAAGSWDNLAEVAPLADQANLAAVKPAWILLEVETVSSGHAWAFFEATVGTWDDFAAQFATWDQFESEDFAWP